MDQQWLDAPTPPTHTPGEGWWPVLTIETPTGWIEQRGYCTPGGGKEVVICFYQLQGDRIIGWWIDAEELPDALSW